MTHPAVGDGAATRAGGTLIGAGPDGLTRAPLCWGQRWSWHENRLPGDKRTPGLHQTRIVDLPRDVDADHLRHALQLALARHAALRSTFASGEYASPRQVVWPVEAQMHELAELDGEEAGLAWLRQRQIDIGSQWPLRAVVGSTRSGATYLGITTHHIATDAHAVQLLCDELVETSSALARRTVPRPAPVGLPPADIAAFEQSTAGRSVNRRAISYWQRHDHELGEVLGALRTRFDTPSDTMHVAQVISSPAVHRLSSLAAEGAASAAAIPVAAIACVLSTHLGRATVPMSMIVLNRDRPGYRRSVSTLAQGGLASIAVPDSRDLASALPAAWSGTLAAMRHGYYDGDELSERMSSFESGGRHRTVAPPSVNVFRAAQPVSALEPADWLPEGTGEPYASRVGQVPRPCLGLNFHVGLCPGYVSIELRAGTHLLSAEDCRQLAAGAMTLILDPTEERR